MEFVNVLLSTYNGEKYLKEQLDSILNQKGVKVKILIRDDGSSDNTCSIIEEYMSKYDNVFLTRGDNIGYAKSFWKLITITDEADYYAFCDQDDIWLEDKLYSDTKMIKEESSDLPILYTSKVISINADGSIISDNCFNTYGTIGVYESLQKSILPGCVFVFNNAAKKIYEQYNGCLESHDWACYAITSIFGKVIYDKQSYIHYRIHGNNAIGKGDAFKEFLIKAKRLFGKRKKFRSILAKDILKEYGTFITDKQLKTNIEELAYYDKNFAGRLKLATSKVYKGLIFRLYALGNRV